MTVIASNVNDKAKRQSKQAYLVVTDLDGTLLEHESYCYDAAKPALALLQAHHIPLIFNSSKTQAEILPLRQALQNQHPFVVENGAAVFCPTGYFGTTASEESAVWGVARSSIIKCAQQLREERGFLFKSFVDWTDEQIAKITGLSVAQAQLAQQRAYSEPLLWEDSNSQLDLFAALLKDHCIRVTQGGRFLTLTGKFDKSLALLWLKERYQRYVYPSQTLITIALGDSLNDQALLEVADIAVIIQSKHAHNIQLLGPKTIIRTQQPGPAGWNEALQALFAKILSDREPYYG